MAHGAALARMPPSTVGASEGSGCRAPPPDADPRRDMAHRPFRPASQKPGLLARGGRSNGEHHHRAALRCIERARTEDHRPDPGDRNCTTAGADTGPPARGCGRNPSVAHSSAAVAQTSGSGRDAGDRRSSIGAAEGGVGGEDHTHSVFHPRNVSVTRARYSPQGRSGSLAHRPRK